MVGGGVVTTFVHASHLPPERWPRLVERGAELPGWVRRGNVVKAVNEGLTLHTYTIPSRPAPMPDGFSWTNLDLCGGWSRPWGVDENEVILRRVLSGEKICGGLAALKEGGLREWRKCPDIAEVRDRVAARPGFSLVESDPLVDGETVRCWVAPECSLGDAVPLDEIAAWYEALGEPRCAELVRLAGDLWLPDRAKDFDDGYWMITGVVLGYPPASTAALLGIR